MDGGFKNRKAQGSKRVKQDLFVNIYRLQKGWRVDTSKEQGLFSKTAGRRGML
jgi:hypothetical protein